MKADEFVEALADIAPSESEYLQDGFSKEDARELRKTYLRRKRDSELTIPGTDELQIQDRVAATGTLDVSGFSATHEGARRVAPTPGRSGGNMSVLGRNAEDQAERQIALSVCNSGHYGQETHWSRAGSNRRPPGCKPEVQAAFFVRESR